MSYRFRLFAAILSIALTAWVTPAAAQSYAVVVESGPYADLADPTIISDSVIEDAYYLDIPFTFKAFGLTFSFDQRYGESTFERLGFLYVANLETDRTWIFDVFLAYLGRLDSSSSMSYRIDRVGSERVLKFQWRNMKLEQNPEGDYLNAQVWIYESTGEIEVRIGPHRVTGLAALGNHSGPRIGQLVADNRFERFFHFSFLTGDVGNPRLDMTGEPNLKSIPPSGTIYRFKPVNVAGVTADVATDRFTFLPNPAGAAARITLPEELAGKNGTLAIYDMLGRVVRTVEGVGDGAMIATDGIPAGLYHCVISLGRERRATTTLIVR